MSNFIAQLGLIFDFLVDSWDQLWILYLGCPVLLATVGLWVLDKVFHIFKLIRG